MSGELILVVEDNEHNAKLVRDVLEFHGYSTVCADNAADGIAQARDRRPALVLMDVQLPDMDGTSALGILRGDPLTRDLTVVALTAFAMDGDRERLLAAGFDDYLAKPIDVTIFPAHISELLAGADGARPATRTVEPPTPDATTGATILCVDDTLSNLKVLQAILAGSGHRLVCAGSGREALELVAAEPPDLILLDVVMPDVDGFEVCRRLRGDPRTRMLPIVMVTAHGEHERRQALDAGADDLIAKPVDASELLARVRSLLRIKSYQDTIERQSVELAELNRTLEARVDAQVAEIEQLRRLQRFLPPQVAEAVRSSGDETLLNTHRALVAVVFCDLRGFTAFSELAEPEDVIGVLHDFHTCIGATIHEYEGTVGFFEGDGLMVMFNDPLPCPDPDVRAVRMAVAMRERMAEQLSRWGRRGIELGFGVGIARGHATLGTIGFEGRYDYGAIGTVVNLAARLCAAAAPGQVLISQSVLAEVENAVEVETLPPLTLKGFHHPVPAFAVAGMPTD
jgi:adenylate cyclase